MTLLSKIKKPYQTQWRRTLMYGPPGVGKSTAAASYSKAIGIPTEDGLGGLGVMAWPVCTAWDTLDAANAPLPMGVDEHTVFTECLRALCSDDHDFQSVIIDSVDWAEHLAHQALCRRYGVASIEKVDGGYGRGYVHATEMWSPVIDLLNYLHGKKKMDIVLIAHAERKKINDPLTNPYDEWGPQVHKGLMAVLVEWAEEVLFLNYKTYTITVEANGRETTRATGGSERVMHTTKSAGFVAKNRLSLPPELPLDGKGYQQLVAQRVAEINQGV